MSNKRLEEYELATRDCQWFSGKRSRRCPMAAGSGADILTDTDTGADGIRSSASYLTGLATKD